MKTTGSNIFLLLQRSGDVHPNPSPATKYPCIVCARNVTSRGMSYECNICSGWVHAKCSRLLNAAQYRRSSDLACGPCSTPPPTPSPPPTPTPPTDQKDYDSTLNVLQLNANGIGNKLAELGVVMKNNEVKVVVIQESKLTPKSKNPCIQNYTTVRKDRPRGQDGGLLIFIHRSVTFSKQPSSTESQYDPHLEELAIEAEIRNTKLIVSNIYIPPASSCSNGHQSSIEHLLTTQDILMLGDLTRTIRLGIQDRPIPEKEKWPTQSMYLTMVFLTETPPREFHLTQSQVRQMSH